MSDVSTSPGQIGSSAGFDPNSVNLTAAADDSDLARQIVCAMQLGQNEYNGNVGARVSAIFVILIVSSAVTFFPVMATRMKNLRIPLYVYLFARYFGAGVIVATAFIHLLDPAYSEIGPQTCVGMTGGWSVYSWVPAIVMTSIFVVFLMDFGAERYVEVKYGFAHSDADVEAIITQRKHSTMDAGMRRYSTHNHDNHQFLHSGDQQPQNSNDLQPAKSEVTSSENEKDMEEIDIRSFQQQIAAFLILEFGVIFHSVIIGLALGTAGSEFSTLYPVLVFHQSFEGLGVGSRMSSIPFPRHLHWLPWALCSAYGLTTPIAVAIGLGLHNTYNSGSYVANVVSGVLDSISCGILIYTGLVELLARDFLFNPERTRDSKQLLFMLACVLFGAGIMALLGKWA